MKRRYVIAASAGIVIALAVRMVRQGLIDLRNTDWEVELEEE